MLRFFSKVFYIISSWSGQVQKSMFIFQLFSNRIELFPQLVFCELIRNMKSYHTETILFPLYSFRSKNKLKTVFKRKFGFYNLVSYIYRLFVCYMFISYMFIICIVPSIPEFLFLRVTYYKKLFRWKCLAWQPTPLQTYKNIF